MTDPSGARRPEFDFTPFKSPVTHGGGIHPQPKQLNDVSCEPLLVSSPADIGGIVQLPLNFRGIEK